MKWKKIILIVALLLVIGGIVAVLVVPNGKEKDDNISNNDVKENLDVLVIGDNYYIAQINDIYINTKNYINKQIEIEGFPMLSPQGGYTFVGRYGPGCCADDGYAYIEYEYDKKLDLVSEEGWIKVTGTIKQGIDQGEEYVYIAASSVEIMPTRGLDTVAN